MLIFATCLTEVLPWAQIEKCNEVYIQRSDIHVSMPWLPFNISRALGPSPIRGKATFSCGGKTLCGALCAAVTLVFYHGSGAVAPRPALAWIWPQEVLHWARGLHWPVPADNLWHQLWPQSISGAILCRICPAEFWQQVWIQKILSKTSPLTDVQVVTGNSDVKSFFL